MTYQDEERTPEEIVEDLDVLGELEAKDVFELADDTAEDSRAADLPTATRRTWLTVRLALLIMLGVVIIVAAIFRYNSPQPVLEPEPTLPVVTQQPAETPPRPAPRIIYPEQPEVDTVEVQEEVGSVFKWHVDFGPDLRARLKYHQGSIYAVVLKGYFHHCLVKLSPGGTEAWRYETSSRNERITFTEGGGALVVDNNAETSPAMIKALDDQGRVKWQYAAVSKVENLCSSPAGDRVFFKCVRKIDHQTSSGRVYERSGASVTALDGSGNELWQRMFTEQERESDPKAYQYIPDKVHHESDLRFEDVESIIAGNDGGVFAVLKGHKESRGFHYVVALDRAGQELWARAIPATGVSRYGRTLEHWIYDVQPLEDGGVLVMPHTSETSSGFLVKLDAHGETAWQFDMGCMTQHGPQIVVSGDHAYVEAKRYAIPSSEHYLVKLRLSDGQPVFDIQLPRLTHFTVAPDGTVYAVAKGLMAISPEGTTLWHQGEAGTGVPLIGSDGTIYTAGYGIYAHSPEGVELYHLPGERVDIGELAVLRDDTLVYTDKQGIKAIEN